MIADERDPPRQVTPTVGEHVQRQHPILVGIVGFHALLLRAQLTPDPVLPAAVRLDRPAIAA